MTMVAQVRRFNRMVTRHVGALDERFLERQRPLAQARLLWEIGTEGAEVVLLRSRLGVDSGQMSRMLRALERDELVTVTPSAGDARVRVVRLTHKGVAERAVLDERSDARAATVLGRLDDAQRGELVRAMRTVERLLAAALVEFRQGDPANPDAQRCPPAYGSQLHRRS